jgi:hypothetical protein
MFFERRDNVSIHTVVSAAAQVLSDLGKIRGFQGWTRNKSIVKSGRWPEWRSAITKFESFFKHADRDPEHTCDFHPEITPLFIIEAVELLRVFTGKFTWPGLIFSTWFLMAYPELILEGELKTLVSTQSALLSVDMNDFDMLAEFLKMRDMIRNSALDAILL